MVAPLTFSKEIFRFQNSTLSSETCIYYYNLICMYFKPKLYGRVIDRITGGLSNIVSKFWRVEAGQGRVDGGSIDGTECARTAKFGPVYSLIVCDRANSRYNGIIRIPRHDAERHYLMSPKSPRKLIAAIFGCSELADCGVGLLGINSPKA